LPLLLLRFHPPQKELWKSRINHRSIFHKQKLANPVSWTCLHSSSVLQAGTFPFCLSFYLCTCKNPSLPTGFTSPQHVSSVWHYTVWWHRLFLGQCSLAIFLVKSLLHKRFHYYL
jgi:hypothetical protein